MIDKMFGLFCAQVDHITGHVACVSGDVNTAMASSNSSRVRAPALQVPRGDRHRHRPVSTTNVD
jgi:hypothetical protein